MKYVSNTTKKPIFYKHKTITPGGTLMLTDEGEVIDNVTVSCTESLRNEMVDYTDHRLAEFSKDMSDLCRSIDKLNNSESDINLNVSCVFSDLKKDLTKYFLCSTCDNCSSLISYACNTPLPIGIYALVGTTKAKTGSGFTAETSKAEMTIPYTQDGRYCVYLSYYAIYCVPISDTFKICTGTNNPKAVVYALTTKDRSIQPKGLCSCYKYVDNTGADVRSSDIDKNALLPKELFTQLLDESILANLSLSVSDTFKRL